MGAATHLSNVIGIYGEDIGLSRLKVVTEVVVGDDHQDLLGVTLFPVELDKDLGVRAGSVDVPRLDGDVVAHV